MKEKIKRNWKIILVYGSVIILLGLYLLFVLDIGISSKYFIKRDFNNAFLYRKTGNCTMFKSYLLRDIEKWGETCIEENDGDGPAIKSFSIKDISVNGDSAFLQVELERSPTVEIRVLQVTGEIKDFEKAYSVNYTMQRQIDTQRILFLLPKTKWFINQELRK
ncbi:MAG: hypothetical protein Q8N65_02305 [bacterium]|nr:hypothetical protein [bacterium]